MKDALRRGGAARPASTPCGGTPAGGLGSIPVSDGESSAPPSPRPPRGAPRADTAQAVRVCWHRSNPLRRRAGAGWGRPGVRLRGPGAVTMSSVQAMGRGKPGGGGGAASGGPGGLYPAGGRQIVGAKPLAPDAWSCDVSHGTA